MAAKRHDRIEPTFSVPSDDEFRISADDRAVPPAANDARRKASRKSAKAGATGKSRDAGRRGISSGSGGSGGGRRRRSIIGHLFRLFVLVAMVGGLAVAGLIGYVAAKLPQEAWAIPDRPPNVKIVSVTGDVLANRGLTGGKAVALDEISPYVPQAVIAIEDRRFYDHYGIDPVGIVRAFFENVQAGETVQGGSTLTQQLAKNIFLSPEQSMERKLQEAVLALWLEHQFTKDQILEMYLNRVYFGSGATGIEAAAGRYYDKPASELGLAEAALLAGLLKAPSRLSPARDPEAAKARAEVVLAAMRETGFIDDTELADARAQKPTSARSYWNGAEHYAADVVMRDILDLVGEVEEDVIVETTIDLDLERAAEKAIRATVDGAKQNVSQGALVAIDGTGAIRAMVGGRDYAQSQFNRAVDAKRQPGSTFKPFVYAAALEAGWRPETMLDDSPVRIGNWSPQNYDNRFRGPVTLADALRQSLNTVAARLVEAVGAPAVIEVAARMGIGSALVENASIALGTSEVSLLELTGAFAPFANGGYQATPHLVNRVTSEGGKVLWERGAEVPPIIISAEVVGMMNAMMTQVVTSGTGQRAAIEGWQAAGKTGTTQEFKDAWFVGYTANLVTGVWLGNDNGANMQKVTGGTLPAQAWRSFMVAAHEGLPATPLPGDYRIGEQEAPLTADSGYGEGGYYDPASPDSGYYYDGAGGAPVPPGDIPRGAIISDGPPPPGLTVEGRVGVGGRPSDESLFRRIFGG